MNTTYTHFGMDSFSAIENIEFSSEVKKHKNLLPSHNTDEIITNIEKLTLKVPNTDLNYTNNQYISIIDDYLVSKNNTTKFRNNVTSDYQSNICCKIKTNTMNIQIQNKKNNHMKTIYNKKNNISFSNQKLWEINRVNQILHKKISNGVKSTYLIQNPSEFMIKATSTINREKKSKDIVKRNEILAKKLTNVKSTFYHRNTYNHHSVNSI